MVETGACTRYLQGVDSELQVDELSVGENLPHFQGDANNCVDKNFSATLLLQ